MLFMEAIVDPAAPGSLLDADHPVNGVLIPRRNTKSALNESVSANEAGRSGSTWRCSIN